MHNMTLLKVPRMEIVDACTLQFITNPSSPEPEAVSASVYKPTLEALTAGYCEIDGVEIADTKYARSTRSETIATVCRPSEDHEPLHVQTAMRYRGLAGQNGRTQQAP